MVSRRSRAKTSADAHWTLSPHETLPPEDPWFVVLGDVLPVRVLGDAPDVVRPEALETIERILGRRVVLDAIFEDPPACIEALARWSGGLVWDVLVLARDAVQRAEPSRVVAANVVEAGHSLGRRRLASMRPEDLVRAVEIHRTHRIEDTEQDRRLLQRSCVLQYGGGMPWWDVHPALRDEELFVEHQRRASHREPHVHE